MVLCGAGRLRYLRAMRTEPFRRPGLALVARFVSFSHLGLLARLWSLACLGLLVLAGCVDVTGGDRDLAAAASGGCGFTGRSTLPIVRLGPFAAVPSTINDRPSLLVVDTGATHTVLSMDVARRNDVKVDPRRMVRSTGIGGTAIFPTGRVDRMMLGGIPVVQPEVTLIPAVPLTDGNVGMDILGDIDLDIDMPDGRITLHRGRLCPGDGPPWEAEAVEVPTVARMPRDGSGATRPRVLLVRMELDGVPALALLDTGAGRTVVSKAFAAKLGVGDALLAQGPRLRLVGLSLDQGEGRTWQFHEARFGGAVYPAPTMIVADLHEADFDLVVGMDFLARHRVWISYGARRIFVARP
jgi:predicted aspartyl protease